METNLKNVIAQLKKEGVEKVEEKTTELLKNAEEKAAAIIKDARGEKEKILKEAAQEAKRMEENGRAALKQAEREAVIALKSRITALMDSIVRKNIAGNLDPATLKEIIIKVVSHCAAQENFDIEVLLNEKDKEYLRKELETSLKDELKKGVTIKASPSIEKGFRIGQKGADLYYDFTDDAISETFSFYLNKKVKEILDSAADTGEENSG